MVMILLLNLLIAMMTDEFDRLKSKASLEYRLGFARRVLRAELFATGVFRSLAERLLRVGSLEPNSKPPAYYFTWVEVGRNAEGRRVGEGGDIFADFSDSEDEGVAVATAE